MKEVKLKIACIYRHLHHIEANARGALFNHLAMILNSARKLEMFRSLGKDVIPGVTMGLVRVSDQGVPDEFGFGLATFTDLYHEV